MKLNNLLEARYATKQLYAVVAEQYKESPIVVGPFNDESTASKFLEALVAEDVEYDLGIDPIMTPKEFFEYATRTGEYE